MAKLMTRLGELWKFYNVNIYISIFERINNQTRESLTLSWKAKVQEAQSRTSFACDRIQFCFKECHFPSTHDWQPQWARLDCLPLLTNMLKLCSRRKKVILLWYKQILGEMKANNNINKSYSTYLPGSGPETFSPLSRTFTAGIFSVKFLLWRCELEGEERWGTRLFKYFSSWIPRYLL